MKPKSIEYCKAHAVLQEKRWLMKVTIGHDFIPYIPYMYVYYDDLIYYSI